MLLIPRISSPTIHFSSSFSLTVLALFLQNFALPSFFSKTLNERPEGLPYNLAAAAGDFGETAYGLRNLVAVTDCRALRKYRPMVDAVANMFTGVCACLCFENFISTVLYSGIHLTDSISPELPAQIYISIQVSLLSLANFPFCVS